MIFQKSSKIKSESKQKQTKASESERKQTRACTFSSRVEASVVVVVTRACHNLLLVTVATTVAVAVAVDISVTPPILSPPPSKLDRVIRTAFWTNTTLRATC
jgi:hypothetical protein